MIWCPEYECLTRKQTEALQLERLKITLQRVYDKIPAYKEKFDQAGVKPSDVHTLADLAKFPFTTKVDLRDNYPFGLFAVPKKEVVRVHASSGTTGKPIVVGYTAYDMDAWTGCVARMAAAAGVTPHDTAQICFSYGLFTGGFGLHYGLERLGVTVIPISGGNTEKQLMIMQDFGTTTLISTPSYSLYIAEVAEKMGIDMKKMKLRVGLFGGEPWSDGMRREIESRLAIMATDNYGFSEVMGPGVAGECIYANGLHIAEDQVLVETIDPDTGEVLPPGERGELVFTSLNRDACPVVRYRSKDISRIIQEPCACGRTNARMERITGRTDDMMIIRGVNVFPSQIEEVLMGIDGIGPDYQINVFRKGYLDDLEVMVELRDGALLEKFSELENLERSIVNKLHNVLSIHVKVRLVEPHTFERSPGKAKRVNDLRKKE